MARLANFGETDEEGAKIVSFVRKYGGAAPRVLDVGCGYGRNLRLLAEQNWEVLGVEKNPRIAGENRKNGLPCIEPENLNPSQGKFDVLLFSHIVEHFEPTALLAFLDHYFTYAKPGALVLIATPLMSSYFYDDFDHIRPYHPESFLLAFGAGADSQMQFYGKTKLALVDLWYRRSPLRFSYCRGRHIRGPARKLFAIANLSLRILYFFTFRLVGRPDGWVGLFRCSSPENA